MELRDGDKGRYLGKGLSKAAGRRVQIPTR